jgi:hypothetical protein
LGRGGEEREEVRRMKARVKEREGNWEGRDKRDETAELTREQWLEAMELGGGYRPWENLEEETETDNQSGAWWEQSGKLYEGVEEGQEWEPDLAEKEAAWLAEQFPQAAAELAENWDGLEHGEKRNAGQEQAGATLTGQEDREQPLEEANKLLQSEEEKERRVEDWRTERDEGPERGREEDLEGPSPRVEEE